ncbi:MULTISPECIES: phospho-sugar mutase [unclassified Oceanispirochaeta]|uniref:phospho-sugar mutase n=1 Tax=unclassified Oceanispirochaeta TaxID=2635722 RepID=UPI000E099595|nr:MULTISPECIES: phospho-sugar mutase [unclassified Oceanispirochaeta]MBF9017456.1 phospho-sugar mutase [Oceanispirochaeta sp. M2]NPD74028.1 phospho-sugar mutase [Oceanispirochaeta sp. M1]RDG30195.1 phospho-sugar mutase [Oceanispirochaeta sp. M1]
MEREELIAKAKDYLEKEDDSRFSDQVAALLKEEDWEELNDRFYTDLAFGTGGLRGVIGGGLNRMNPYTVRKATQGLASYIVKNVEQGKRRVALAYDSRHYSDLFALQAALVFAGNGIECFLYTSLRPTPQLSYTVRELNCCSGVMVTASHNPAEYNGYKVYWNDGGQITAPHDSGIIAEVRAVTDTINVITEEKAKADGLLHMIDADIDKPYLDMVIAQSLRPELVKEKGKDLKVVYTPLHGCGTIPVENALSRMGITVVTVKEQREPDGAFPTVAFPNPEITPAMQMALDYAVREKADLVMGTDPDADRLGIAVPQGDGYTLITGNQLGCLLTDYIFLSRKELGTLPENAAFVNTIVTTDLQLKIAESYGAETFKVLTGFKFIGEKMREFEESGSHTYIFGGEESYGFLVENEVRDKDAVSAATMTAEMALWNVAQGRSVLDHLNDIYARFGYYEESLISQYFKGESGQDVMAGLMTKLRETPPASLGGVTINALKDYKDGTTRNLLTEEMDTDIDLPSSNVLQFVLEDGSLITARPSGTEPKIKFYASICGEKGQELAAAKEQVAAKMKAIEADIMAMMPQG